MEPTSDAPRALLRLGELSEAWNLGQDGRVAFLSCYEIMTRTMASAVDARDFADPDWVGLLLERFAEYYFDALDAYDADPAAAPAVWRVAHDSCCDDGVWVLQRLLLGINAHINVDLALTLEALLTDEWAGLGPEIRQARLDDYRRVNVIIAGTVDAVQDSVLEAAVPALAILDVLLGPVDEFVASRLLFHWRDDAWDFAVRLLEAADAEARAAVVAELESQALRTADAILAFRSVE